MNDDEKAEPPGDGSGRPLDVLANLVAECSPDELAKLIHDIRETPAPVPEDLQAQAVTAVRLLHAFALRNSIDRLIVAARDHLKYRDAINVLATAAVCRSVREAAELTVKLHEVEIRQAKARPSRMTDDIIRDIARQRPVPDISNFIKLCSANAHRVLVDKMVGYFADPSSGRRNLDKALLYITLEAEKEEGCESAARDLLRLTLTAIHESDTGRADTEPAEQPDDLVGALHELSPSDPVLERWIDRELRSPQKMADTIKLVAKLLASSPDGSEALAEHVGRDWRPSYLIALCGELLEKYPERCAAVRKHASSSRDLHKLSEIINKWHLSDVLAKTTRELLTDVVAMRGLPTSGPRSIEELTALDLTLRIEHAHADCNRLLWRAAAEHIVGRSGEEIADLLGKVTKRQDRRQAAQIIAERLATLVIEENGGANKVFVDYLSALPKGSEAARNACRELADPSQGDPLLRAWAEVIADVANELYRRGLRKDGNGLLERYLEHELLVKPDDVATVVKRLRGKEISQQELHNILRMTVGRWYDVGRREAAITELQRRECPAEADAITGSD